MNFKSLLFLPPVALAVIGFIWMTKGGEPQSEIHQETGLAVRVTTVHPKRLILSATGYGRVEAVRSWTAVSQVDGRVVGLVGDLAEGTVIDQGAVLVQIYRTDFELAIQKSKANIAGAEATLAELERQKANSSRLLALENRILEVARAEYERVSNLVERGTSTAASLDTSQKTLLAQENAVTNLTNTLELFPAKRASAEATLAVRRAELAEAERGLANTTIAAPFRGRVADKSVEADQFVRTGEQLLTLEAIDSAEVVASFQPQAFSSVIQFALGQTIQQAVEIDATKVIELLRDRGVTATVQLDVAGFNAEYPAEIVRFRGTIDNETGTIGLAVRIDDPFLAGGPARRPPLNVGSFVSVVLETQTPEDAIAIPRTALHHGDDGAPFVYLADSDDRLSIVPVTLGPVAGDNVLIRDSLIEDDRLVLSAPRPPIEGMRLTPVSVDGAVQ
ncbi:efflux RND transporter periplasmic adaptor subunit [Thalassovita sp.]|uniref:efflux RND transporter periplasmic adaptor subunit n=1 Tax=Thalassovita sp. TaxID=1979401 RepID=UPI002B271752|nr:HlyD family efflux transporter periplasmic adaptor subunit [Thalassovita sp.]